MSIQIPAAFPFQSHINYSFHDYFKYIKFLEENPERHNELWGN